MVIPTFFGVLTGSYTHWRESLMIVGWPYPIHWYTTCWPWHFWWCWYVDMSWTVIIKYQIQITCINAYIYIYINSYKHAILQDKIGRLKLVLDKHPQQHDRNLDIRRSGWNHGNSQDMFDLRDHQNYQTMFPGNTVATQMCWISNLVVQVLK